MKEMIMWDKYDNKYREVVDVEVARGLESDLYEANNRIVDLMNIIDERDRIIDKMAEDIIKYETELGYEGNYKNKEEVIKYFEERCSNAKD